MVSSAGIEAIRLNVLNASKNNNLLIIIGFLLSTISFLSIIYFGSITVKDVSSGNIAGPNNLPKTSFGPFSAYHLEYASVFIFLFGTILLCFGIFGKTKPREDTE